MSIQSIDSKKEPEDVLVKTLFHRTLLLFSIPAEWASWKVALSMVLVSASVTAFWLVVTGQLVAAIVAGLIQLVFMIADALLLNWLPRAGYSYGPWQSQLFALAIPRLVFSLAISIIGVVAGVFWGWGALLAAQLIGTGALIYGAMVEPFHIQLTHLKVGTQRLDEDSKPIKILHISDLHIERLTRREKKMMDLIHEAQADLILITGDYINLSYVYDPLAHEHVRRLLSQLSAPYGVYATLGSPPVDERDVVPALFADLPIRLLVDEWEEVNLDDGRRLVLLGIDCSHHLQTDRQRLDDLVSISPNSMPSVLLYHAPDLMPEASSHGIDLYLCGHTHGGQVRLPGYGAILTSSQLGKKYEMGLYRDGRTHLYVSRGVGLEGLSAPRVRFLAPPEITLITLNGQSDPLSTS